MDSSTDSGCTPFTDDKMPGGVAWNGVEWAYGPELVCITSPDYPDDYPHNAECVYSVLVDELHTITVDFATEEDYDFLTINGKPTPHELCPAFASPSPTSIFDSCSRTVRDHRPRDKGC